MKEITGQSFFAMNHSIQKQLHEDIQSKAHAAQHGNSVVPNYNGLYKEKRLSNAFSFISS